ncbi:MAG: hypothetical protein ABSF09_08375 [Candidatus Bathyarchaeia archaeon]
MIDMTRHEDEKAGRILAPMAFLTVAYAAIFASFLGNGVRFRYLSYDLITLVFLFYITCVTIGAVFLLEAFGPRFNLPKPWNSSISKEAQLESGVQSTSQKVPKSIFFFEHIAKEPREEWTKYFSNSPEVLEQKAVDDLVFEIHLISEKVSTKVNFVRRGKFFFFLAMLFFVFGTLLGAASIIRGN